MTIKTCDRMIERYTKSGDAELTEFWTKRRAHKIAHFSKYAHLREQPKPTEVKSDGGKKRKR